MTGKLQPKYVWLANPHWGTCLLNPDLKECRREHSDIWGEENRNSLPGQAGSLKRKQEVKGNQLPSEGYQR